MKYMAGLLCGFLGSIQVAQAQVVQCHGNEPFWGMTVGLSEVVFNRDNESVTAIKGPLKTAHGMQDSFLQKFDLNQEKKTVGDFTLIKVNCSDGMSDIEYPYQVIVDFYDNNKIYYGCCRP